jgi:hypothetical protein
VALLLVSITFVGLALAVALGTPPWEANDEHHHARNIETLRSGRWYRIEPGAGLEPHQPPLYYLVLAGYAEVIGLADNDTEPASRETLRDFRRNPGLWRHDVHQDGVDTYYVRRLRLPSVGLGLTAVLLTAFVARLVSRDRWTPVVAAAICAFVPKFVVVSGTANNDNLANALGALVCLAAVYVATRPGPARRPIVWSALLGILVGALVLTKLSALPLVAGIALATVFMVRNGPDDHRALRLVGAFATNAAVAFAVSGWWLVRNVDRYGDPFASDAAHDYFREVSPPLVLGAGASLDRAFVDLPRELWRTFWYSSGWNQLRWDEWSYLPFWLLLAVALLGLARRSRSGLIDDADQRASRGLWVLGALALGAVASYWIIGFETTGGEARVMFAGLPAIATLAALGLQRLRIPILARFTLPVIGIAGVTVALDNHVFGYYGG